MTPKILFVINVDWFFLSHRLPIALEAQRRGYEVHVAVCITDRLEELKSYGFFVHPLTMARGRAGLKKEIISFYEIFYLFKKLQPDIVHLVTIKPVLFGGIAARLAGVPGVVAAISGLGSVYATTGLHASIKRFITNHLYPLALGGKNLRVIFQNDVDQQILVRIAGLAAENIILLNGSGINLEIFKPRALPSGIPVIVMACRLIADKGVWQFVEAARILHERGLVARFCLAGTIDPDNPASLSALDIAKIKEEGVVELLGQRNDMENVLAMAQMVVLPSFYGEGLPKVLIEAAACGRAVVTTDIPGCRDAIEPGVTGLLVPARDSKALALAISELLKDTERCKAFGAAGRALAERKFDIHSIVKAHMQIYEGLLKR